eukprot:scaffold104126_cov20-Prasinocladus_malaysianus.AAC.1
MMGSSPRCCAQEGGIIAAATHHCTYKDRCINSNKAHQSNYECVDVIVGWQFVRDSVTLLGVWISPPAGWLCGVQCSRLRSGCICQHCVAVSTPHVAHAYGGVVHPKDAVRKALGGCDGVLELHQSWCPEVAWKRLEAMGNVQQCDPTTHIQRWHMRGSAGVWREAMSYARAAGDGVCCIVAWASSNDCRLNVQLLSSRMAMSRTSSSVAWVVSDDHRSATILQGGSERVQPRCFSSMQQPPTQSCVVGSRQNMLGVIVLKLWLDNDEVESQAVDVR